MSVPKILKEAIAEVCHDQWSGWMKYLFSKSIYNADGSVTISPKLTQRWARQMNTKYCNLSQAEQDSDRKEADKFLAFYELPTIH